MRLFFLLLLLAVFPSNAILSQTAPVEELAKEETVPIQFALHRAGSIEIISLQRNGKVYLPIQDVFNFLKIKNEYNASARTLTGFYITADTPYVIDLVEMKANVGKRTVVLGPEDFLVRNDKMYLRVGLFDEVFGLPVEYKERQLSAKLATRESLPIFLDQRLKRLEHELALRQGSASPDAVLPRPFIFLDGVRLDYSLTQSLAALRTPLRTYSTQLGADILGGDVEARFIGRLPYTSRTQQTRARWRFVPSGTTAIRQGIIGDFVTSGLIPRQAYGLQVTNRPPYRRIVFGNELFSGSAQAARNVYFYNNVQLAEIQPATTDGQYVFETPILYGSNLIDVRSYSEWGELFQDSYRIIIPPNMIPPGEVEYEMSAGRLRDENGLPWYANMSTSWGTTSHVTNELKMEYYDMDFLPTKIFPSFNNTTRITEHLIGEAVISPNALFRGSLSLASPLSFNGSFSYTKYRSVTLFNPRNAINEMSASASAPLWSNGFRFAMDISGQQTIFKVFRERNFQIGASLATGIVSLRVFHLAGWSYSYNLNSTALVNQETAITLRGRLPANVLLIASTRFNHIDRRFTDLGLSTFVTPMPNFVFDFQYDRNLVFQSNLFRLRLRYAFPFVRVAATSATNSGALVSGSRTVYSQSVSGSIGVAPIEGDVFFDYRGQDAGYGGLFVLPFDDANGNGVRDASEKILTDAKVRGTTALPGGGHTFTLFPGVGWGTTRAAPYEDYVVSIDRKGFENPLAIPRYNTFQVAVQPGRFSYIEIPVVNGGSIRGAVRNNLGGVGVEGLTVRLREIPGEESGGTPPRIPYEQTTKTFSTGEFEFIAVPPGDYQISLDPLQIENLGFVAQPWTRQISVESKADGDFHEGVDFSLTRR